MLRLYIERKQGFQNEANRIFGELTNFLGIAGITGVRYLNRYDIENTTLQAVQAAAVKIFSEPQSDICYFNDIPLENDSTIIEWEYLPGQYDQRSDSAEQCLSLLLAGIEDKQSTQNTKPRVRCAKIVILTGSISANDTERIQHYLINPVDSRIASPELPESLEMKVKTPDDIPIQTGFINYSEQELSAYMQQKGLAMDLDDIKFLQSYFKKAGRDPTETEIRVLDTYWSDHCRHTTFNTVLDNIEIDDGPYKQLFQESLNQYTDMRTELYAERVNPNSDKFKPVTLMDMACIGAKYLKAHGKLDNIELSEEINACSIFIDVHYKDISSNDELENSHTEKWLLQFKNETHNHPTEIEPFGGAATCIGGAIRDPLSGRAWVYQALRVTGSGDPTVPISQTRAGKLPQMKLTREAAQGFSSYGNQIGLTTGQVSEIYDSGFEAKRMELGAVIAAVPADRVKREEPNAGDIVVLIGGGTGRDGIGGATGSSKVHTKESVTAAAAEVQKGNAVEERKIQRMFRNPDVANMIRRCNDFGAGGVAVAVGELAPGLDINLDAVPKKYEGLNGTELAISESQERMAIVVRAKDVESLQAAAAAENLNSAVIATVTDTNRLVMKWRGKTIVDIERSFLDTAGASRKAIARILSPDANSSPLCASLPTTAVILAESCSCNHAANDAANSTGDIPSQQKSHKLERAWKANLQDKAVCSQRGLSERFDGSIGSASVLFPMGGKYQSTPEAGMAAKIPVLPPYETDTTSLMSFGYDPRVSSWSPYHGAQYAVIQSLSRITAMGGDSETSRLTFQEYFERTVSAESWGKPVAALLGALDAQKEMGTPSIGGKDSMSGSFQEIHVPPTLVSFAVGLTKAQNVTSASFKKPESKVYLVLLPVTQQLTPDFKSFALNSRILYELNKIGKISAMQPIGAGGIAEAVSKMSFGNKIGFSFNNDFFDTFAGMCPIRRGNLLDKGLKCTSQLLFLPLYGSMLVEVQSETDLGSNSVLLGETIKEPEIRVKHCVLDIDDLQKAWESPLEKVFPTVSLQAEKAGGEKLPRYAESIHKSLNKVREIQASKIQPVNSTSHTASHSSACKPRILLPVFPGTNCEYDMARAFELSGGDTKILVFRNNTPEALSESLVELAAELDKAQILALSGGFSCGDEPDGSGKFIANVLRESRIADSIMSLLKNRNGLVLGICNGFQALIKTGLLPYGEILEPSETMPTLTFNTIGRHISRIVRTRLVSASSPWANNESVISPEMHIVPISHGEGRIIIDSKLAKKLFSKGQIFTQYCDEKGMPTMTEPDNPNGSMYAIEGITSPDGHILGKMGHSERTIGTENGGQSTELLKNIICSEPNGTSSCQNIFAAGIKYFN